VRAGLAAVSLVVVLAGCSSSSHKSPYATSGFSPQLPSFLPTDTINARTDRVLLGTAAHPALTSQGDAVDVRTPSWSARAVVSGPVVPGEGLPYETQSTTCTWTVTLSHATGRVPISLGDFNGIDHLGTSYRMSFVQGQPLPPSVLLPGHSVTFKLRAYEATGEGIMRWAPVGQKIVAEWDYEVEND
jgi:hypothetical protein